MAIKPDVLIFNFGSSRSSAPDAPPPTNARSPAATLTRFLTGMHDGPMFNDTFPGQNAPPDNYAAELTAITASLLARTAAWGAKLAFVQTTEYMCSAISDGCVQNLNNQAAAVMAAAGVPVIKMWDAMHDKCGDSPTACGNAFNMTNGLYCPHANGIAYEFFGTTVLVPAILDLLG